MSPLIGLAAVIDIILFGNCALLSFRCRAVINERCEKELEVLRQISQSIINRKISSAIFLQEHFSQVSDGVIQSLLYRPLSSHNRHLDRHQIMSLLIGLTAVIDIKLLGNCGLHSFCFHASINERCGQELEVIP